MVQDTSKIKDDIISFLRLNGPSLPVHIAGKIGNSILFTSAFLSELLSEKRVKMSNMRVGNSPLYFLQGQEPRLEKFAEHLRNKEKEAFLLLKEKRFLMDKHQQPAIRVAIRDVKDFAIPFKRNDEIYWRYFTVPESEFQQKKPQEEKREAPKLEVQEPEGRKIEPKKPVEKETPEKELGIFERTETVEDKPKKTKKVSKKTPKKKSQKSNEKFFNDVKEFLSRNSIDLKDILNFSKKEISLLVSKDGRERILVAFDKKRPDEKDISVASKKAKEHNLPYILLSKSEPLKKISNLIEDIKNMDSMKSLDDHSKL